MKWVERAGWQQLLLGGLLVLGACGGSPTGGGDGVGKNSAGATARSSALPVSATGSVPLIRPQGPKSLPKGHESNDATKKDEYCHRRLEDVALTGEEVPGTDGGTFNPITFASPLVGFLSPMVNDQGNVAFLGSYGGLLLGAPVAPAVPSGPGAGVFYWEHDDDELEPVALSGQMTEVGVLPPLIVDYRGTPINDHNQVAFDASNIIGSATSALFQWTDKRDHLKVIAKQGDQVPDAGTLVDLGDLEENNDGDVAFIAAFAPAPLPGTAPVALSAGIFFKEDESNHVEVVAKLGDVLPGTNGGTICAFQDGPWLNDDDTVFFQVNCITGGTPGLIDSIFMKRKGQPVEPFWLVGSSAPSGGFISDINAGHPAANNHDFAAEIRITGGSVPEEIATKEIEEGEYGVETCAADGATLDDGSKVWCRSQEPDGGAVEVGPLPTIARDGTVGFAGLLGPATPTLLTPIDGVSRDAIFTCHDGKVKLIAFSGEKAPKDVGGQFGTLDAESNADGHVVFEHMGALPDAVSPPTPSVDVGFSPTGVFIDDTCE